MNFNWFDTRKSNRKKNVIRFRHSGRLHCAHCYCKNKIIFAPRTSSILNGFFLYQIRINCRKFWKKKRVIFCPYISNQTKSQLTMQLLILYFNFYFINFFFQFKKKRDEKKTEHLYRCRFWVSCQVAVNIWSDLFVYLLFWPYNWEKISSTIHFCVMNEVLISSKWYYFAWFLLFCLFASRNITTLQLFGGFQQNINGNNNFSDCIRSQNTAIAHTGTHNRESKRANAWHTDEWGGEWVCSHTENNVQIEIECDLVGVVFLLSSSLRFFFLPTECVQNVFAYASVCTE